MSDLMTLTQEQPLPPQDCTGCGKRIPEGDESWLETNTHTGRCRTIAQAERHDAEDWDVLGRSSGWAAFDPTCYADRQRSCGGGAES